MAFDLTGLGSLFDFASKVIDRVVPDPAQKAAAQLEVLKLSQSGELAQLTAETQLAVAQATTNTAEATTGNLFIAGWRPFIGWVCGTGLGIQFIVSPLLTFIADFFGKHVVMPTLDTGTLLTLLFGMLGLGAMRSAEKIKGVA